VDLSATARGNLNDQHSHQTAPTQVADSANSAARDQNVRCRSYGVMRKLAGLPQDLFANYWRDVLGPLCAQLPGVDCYAQHYFSQDHWAGADMTISCSTFAGS
jgi:hypothetical protein